MGSRVSLTLPTGDETEYPAVYVPGMIRYNEGAYNAITNPNGDKLKFIKAVLGERYDLKNLAKLYNKVLE